MRRILFLPVYFMLLGIILPQTVQEKLVRILTKILIQVKRHLFINSIGNIERPVNYKEIKTLY